MSQNPAELARAVLVDSDDGLGKWVSDSDLDLTGTWDDCANYCGAQVLRNSYKGDPVKEDRHHLDLVVDSLSPAQDWLTHMLGLFRSGLVEWGGKLHLVTDKASTGAVRTFSASASPGTLERFLAKPDGSPDFKKHQMNQVERTTHVKAQYYDEGDGFERKWTEEYVGSEYTSDIPPVRQELFLPGITRQSEAKRQARYTLNRARFSPTFYEWGAGMGAMDLVPFDVVQIYLLKPTESIPVQIIAATRREDGTGRLVGMKYDVRVYTDNTDILPKVPAFKTRQEALARRLKIPYGASNVTVKDITS